MCTSFALGVQWARCSKVTVQRFEMGGRPPPARDDVVETDYEDVTPDRTPQDPNRRLH